MPTLVHVTDVGTAAERGAVLDELSTVTFTRQRELHGGGPRRAWAGITSPAIATLLFAWVREDLGEVTDWPVSDELRRTAAPLDQWRFAGAEPFLRLYRYERGDSFAHHRDEERTITPTVRSALTLLLYLPHDGRLLGGETFVGDQRVEPLPWSVVVFAHDVWHHGAEVLRGTKTVVRSDVLITRDVSRGALMGQG